MVLRRRRTWEAGVGAFVEIGSLREAGKLKSMASLLRIGAYFASVVL